MTAAMLPILICLIGPLAWAVDACKQPGRPAANIELVKTFYASFNTKNKALLDNVLAPDWIDIPLAQGQGPGREGLKEMMNSYFASFPDMNVKNEDFITQGNQVVVRSTLRGTQKGAFAGVKPSGKRFEILVIDVHQICNGRVLKTWHAEDWLSGLFQMGGLPLQK
jgi:steroid delta-isomerase-like uncharacterized protein